MAEKTEKATTASLMKEALKLPEKAAPNIDDAVPNGLWKKIAWVMERVERVPKSGYNDFFKYWYATEADLVDGLRPLLARAGLVFLWSCKTAPDYMERKRRNGSTFVCSMLLEFKLLDADTGESHVAEVWGTGEDGMDKGPYKVYTGAEKYFLMKTFLIPTGDDPEQAAEEEYHDGGEPSGRAPAKQEPKPVLTEQQLAAMCGDALSLVGALNAGAADGTFKLSEQEADRLVLAANVLRDQNALEEATVNAATWVGRLAAHHNVKFADG